VTILATVAGAPKSAPRTLSFTILK
jgi:hypothetical protein